ncbi:hypothetical protein BY458DRAFT_107661 [Sporodiniella umbellata]|nr:hypothetical protein BY458DRAFT_107661 [Sporodiniella umbellata]
MSRHRAVRNLDVNDILEEDDYNSDYDENQLDESELTNEELDLLDEGLEYIEGVIGLSSGLSSQQIKESLWYYYLDKEETLAWALDEVAKLNAIEEKKKAKEKAKKGKDGYRREYC